jgi:hypothetical protein
LISGLGRSLVPLSSRSREWMFAKRLRPRAQAEAGIARQLADAPCPIGLLRPCRERPRRRTAEQPDELSPAAHSITSSAIASTPTGMASPSALAVLKLIATYVDGVVWVQGTNAIEETAYFLSLTVQSEKPIVVTGAQRHITA